MIHDLTLKLLRSYYPTVLCLRDYLALICEPNLELEKPDDLDRYLSLVRTSYVALAEPLDASTQTRFSTGEVMSEMYEVIDRVQVKLFQRVKGRPLNVLTMGYRRADSRDEHGRADMSRQAITNFFPNTNITALQALEWKILLTRIGEAAMYHLLLNASVFIALPQDSFCQLVGTPITELKPQSSGFLPIGNACEKEMLKADTANNSVKRAAEPDQRPPKRRKFQKADEAAARTEGKPLNVQNTTKRTPADITFVRARIFHARPVTTKDLNSRRTCIAVGLPLRHVLHRLAPATPLANGDVPSKEHIAGRDARHVLKHIFPRQFGLKHPFDTRQVLTHKFKSDNYAAREEEIQMRGNVKTPKRLKPVLELVRQLIKRHWDCNYRGIRSRACPSKLKKVRPADRQDLDSAAILEMMSEGPQNPDIINTRAPSVNMSADSHPSLIFTHGASMAEKAVKLKPKFSEFTCYHSEVFVYVLKATKAVIPNAFWGCQKNFKTVMKHVREFIECRRFETITLHSVLQKFSTQECDWLLPENPIARHQRPSVTDAIKRRELVEEFLYWYFESFVIPLLRTTFYVTESNAPRHQVLFFRQDDWATLCRPLLERLTEETFERLTEDEAQTILNQRKLGFSFVRLLPKETGVRPIVNLRRKPLQQSDGSPALSINQVLQATFQILTYEKNTQPDLLGASVFGIDEIYAKLKSFKTRLLEMKSSLPKLYFVKIDVRACFDSIEQGKLLEILQKILTEDGYMIQRFSRTHPVAGKVQRSFWKRACPEADHPHFLTYATKLARTLRHAVFVDQVVYSYEDREEVLNLLKEHVTENIVKIGNHFYRQTVGIPQGSVLSTILCSFFYGDLETKVFKFTEDGQSMLCRLVDDYLFVTANESKARKFLDMMNTGHPEYGCFISPEKTLTNFDTDEYIMNRTLPGQSDFPWCGLWINMSDLSVSRDYSRYTGTHIRDTMSIDRGRNPGAIFKYRMLHMARMQTNVIFFDTSLNTEYAVHRNVYQNFLLGAMKMCCLLREWRTDLNKPNARKFILDVIHRLIRFTYVTLRSKVTGWVGRAHGAVCTVRELSVIWLGSYAFWTVITFKRSENLVPIAVSLELDIRNPRFVKSWKRWGSMVKEAGRMLEQVRF